MPTLCCHARRNDLLPTAPTLGFTRLINSPPTKRPPLRQRPFIARLTLALLSATAPAMLCAQERIVALSPHATEMLFFLGAGEQIVGTVEYSDYPPAAREIPRVGGVNTLSVEKILSLQPTLVTVWTSGNPPGIGKTLEHHHIEVIYSDPASLAGIHRDLYTLQARLAPGAEGEKSIRQFESDIQQLRQQHASKPRLKVFYEVWQQPLYTLGGRHFFNDLLEICGGENVFGDIRQPAPVVSIESLLVRKPDMILASEIHGGRSLSDWREEWRKWQQIPAVMNGHLYQVDADIFTRPTPRALVAAKTLCALLDESRPPASANKR